MLAVLAVLAVLGGGGGAGAVVAGVAGVVVGVGVGIGVAVAVAVFPSWPLRSILKTSYSGCSWVYIIWKVVAMRAKFVVRRDATAPKRIELPKPLRN